MFTELEEEIKRADEIVEVQFDKLPDVKLGDKIKITWDEKEFGSYENVDYGYCFGLPGIAFDEGAYFIHIENPINPNGKDAVEEVFIHSYNLADNKYVKRIEKC